MAYFNEPNSNLNVVSNLAFVLDQWRLQLQAELDGLNFIYSPSDLSYETCIKLLREDNASKGSSSAVKEPYPLFAFSRSTMRVNENSIASRNNLQKATVDDEEDENRKKILRFTHCAVDLDFMFFAASLNDLERFEISYLAERGISGIRGLTVDIPDVGEHDYKIKWSTLDNFQISDHQSQDNVYLSIGGKCTISGLFFLFEGDVGIIREIRSRIIGPNLEVLANTEING